MSSYPIKINGTTIKTPKSFKIEKYNVTKAGRVASAKMKIKFIAKKTKLILSYDAIRGTELDTILDLIDTTTMFFTVSYYDKRGTLMSKTFYTGQIPQTLHTRGMSNDDDVWKDVEIHFIEE
jgi:hypothetical protein